MTWRDRVWVRVLIAVEIVKLYTSEGWHHYHAAVAVQAEDERREATAETWRGDWDVN